MPSPHPGDGRWVACVRIPAFPVQVEVARRPELAGRPVVIASTPSLSGGSGAAVGWCSKEAEREGIRCGMPLREVFAACRECVVLPADFRRYERVHEAFLDALEKAVPAVETGGLGAAYADLSGLERLYPNRARLLAELAGIASSAGGGLRVNAAAGPNKFVSGVAAEECPGLRIVPPEEAAGFLSPLSVDRLWVSDEMRRRLLLFGLRRMGQVASLDLAALEAQFGKEGRRAWELSRGIDGEPVLARRAFRPIVESLFFPSPLGEWPAFWAGVRELLRRAFEREERGGLTVRQIELLARIDEETWQLSVTLHEPVGDLERLEGMLRRRLEGVKLPGALSELHLKLALLGGAYAGQEPLFAGSGERWKRIREALAAVKARSGSTGLYRILEVEPWSRIPERRFALIRFEP